MKIATHLLLFNQDKWIVKNIEMIEPFVDKIYVAWSEYPWNYNPNARGNFKNSSNPDMLKELPCWDKIEIIKGVWDKDEDQRNACLDAAKRDGMDYLLIIDADEFYTNQHLYELIEGIKENPNYDYYTTPWVTFWKDLNHLLIAKDNHGLPNIVCGYPEVALNINSGNRFTRCRRPTGKKIKQLGSLCFHASYVLTDDECWSKINTWGHAHQFNRKRWFDNIWKNWKIGTKNLHPISPDAWLEAKPKPPHIQLPDILKTI